MCRRRLKKKIKRLRKNLSQSEAVKSKETRNIKLAER